MDFDDDTARIVMLRGLGYSQREIAQNLGLTQSKVWYRLNEVNEAARDRGDTAVFTSVLVDGFLPKIIEKARKLERLV